MNAYQAMSWRRPLKYLPGADEACRARRLAGELPWPPNVWIGVSVKEARVLDRFDDLRHIRASVRFLSCQPLLGSLAAVDLDGIR